jgi:D-beta-D-heptose 7-phosphate kinase/D-beta-D-heptose 1-phosphate adenosyltransferase
MMKEIGSDYNVNELTKYIGRFPATNILVIGDIILDEYIWGDVSRISPEAPVPVVAVQEETKMFGGAANVINNICSLGGKSILCGVIGDDETGREIVEKLESLGQATNGIISEKERRTSIKTRVVAHNQQVVRFDKESRKEIGPDSVKRILGFIREVMDSLDAVIVADYGKGVISGELMNEIRKLLKKSDITRSVDPKTENFTYYESIDLMTPNHHEAGAFCRLEIVNEETLIKAGTQIIQELNCRSVLITQGKDGMTLFEKGGDISHIPTVARQVFDVTGAGDTVISTLCLSLASGMDLKSAAVISNFAAGIVVGEVGTSTVSAEELIKALNNHLV